MPRTKTVRFTPVARLQKILGSELIADPNVAVIELVKNSYDAGASEVLIRLQTVGRELHAQTMIIADNGTGMDTEIFQKSWMSPGYSEKAPEAGRAAPLPSQLEDDSVARAKSRAQTGEKGLGRLAVARLAERVRVQTRPRPEDDWIIVDIDWAKFDTMDKPLTRVTMPLKFSQEAGDSPFPKGTTMVMSGLKVNWSARIPGRLAPGRSRTRLGRLKQDLSMLVLPLPGQTSEGFRIRIEADDPDLESFTGEVEPLNRELDGYQFTFRVETEPGLFKVERVVKRTPAIAQKTAKSEYQETPAMRDYSYFSSDLAKASLCGPFKGTIFYQPDLPRKSYGKAGVPGVFLYRDGIRVEPYGLDGDDWLQATAWKAARQGHAPIQPHQLVGYVQISYEENPELRDMSNRLGLIDNTEFQLFTAIARHEFRWFGDLIYDEYVSVWPQSDERVALRAEHSQRFTRLLVQELTHSIRQSTSGLGAEITRLSTLAAQEEIDPSLRSIIRSIAANSSAHINRIDQVVNQTLDLEGKEIGTIQDVPMNSVVDDAIADLRPLGNSLGVNLIQKKTPNAAVSGNRHALQRALDVLGHNAIESAAERKGAGSVTFDLQPYKYRTGEIGWRVLVSDNGPGINPTVREKLLEAAVSTKGRQGTGLRRAREILLLFGADLRIGSTGQTGTTMEIVVPRRAKVRD